MPALNRKLQRRGGQVERDSKPSTACHSVWQGLHVANRSRVAFPNTLALDWCTPGRCRLAARPKSAESGHKRPLRSGCREAMLRRLGFGPAAVDFDDFPGSPTRFRMSISASGSVHSATKVAPTCRHDGALRVRSAGRPRRSIVVSSVLSPVALMVARGRFINPNRCAKHIRSPS
jgi:hypothetical protein